MTYDLLMFFFEKCKLKGFFIIYIESVIVKCACLQISFMIKKINMNIIMLADLVCRVKDVRKKRYCSQTYKKYCSRDLKSNMDIIMFTDWFCHVEDTRNITVHRQIITIN